MAQRSNRYRPWIWRRMLWLALACGLIPAGLLTLILVTLGSGSGGLTQSTVDRVAEPFAAQLKVSMEAQAARIDARLSRISTYVLVLGWSAEQVLGNPQVYGRFTEATPPSPSPVSEPPKSKRRGQTKKPTPPAAPEQPPATTVQPPFDNPIYYSAGTSGPIYKVIDNGGPGVYYRLPEYGKFTHEDRQRLYATGALDSVMAHQTGLDPLCSQVYLVTEQDLIRTYPFHDFAGWPADQKLYGTSIAAFTKDKANPRGVVWTSPYVSKLSNTWVVSCQTGVVVGGQQVAVVGCEVPLAKLSDELLSFSLGSGGICWLYRPDSIVLASQPGGDKLLGIKPVAQLDVPVPGEAKGDSKAAADPLLPSRLAWSGQAKLVEALGGQVLQANQKLVKPFPLKAESKDGPDTFILARAVADPNWILGGYLQSQALATVQEFHAAAAATTEKRLLAAVLVLILCLVLAFALTWLESRRVTRPLAIITQQLNQVTASRGATSVTLADEGELGALANAAQRLIDAASVWRNAPSDDPDSVKPPAGD